MICGAPGASPRSNPRRPLTPPRPKRDDAPVETEFSELLRRAKLGDAAALSELHARYERLVRSVVRRQLGPELRRRTDSIDLTQSVFEDVLRELPAFEDRGEGAFRHWITLKAENKVKDAWRRKLRPEGGVRERGIESGDEEPAGGDPGPATQAGDADEVGRLREVLATLTNEQREVIALRDEEGLAWAEVAARLGLDDEDAARMRYSRALNALRRKWRDL